MEIGGGNGHPTYVLYFGSGNDPDVITAKELEQRFPGARMRTVPGGLFVEMSAGPVYRAAGGDVMNTASERAAAARVREPAD